MCFFYHSIIAHSMPQKTNNYCRGKDSMKDFSEDLKNHATEIIIRKYENDTIYKKRKIRHISRKKYLIQA